MADPRITRFVELQQQAEQLLLEDKVSDAKQKYLEVLDAYNAIHTSELETFHKDLAYDQVTTLFKKVNAAKERVNVPYNVIAAAILVIAFSFLVVMNPSIVGLASFQDLVHQPVNKTFTESGIEPLTLRDQPLTLAASGTFTGKAKIFLKQGEKLELVFDSETSPSDNGKFIDVCEETCDVSTSSNTIELFIQVDEGSITIEDITYKVERTQNTAPAWTSDTRTFTIAVGEPTTIDLSQHFTDDEDDKLVYLSTTNEGLDIHVENSKVTITATSPGERRVMLIASDLLDLTKVPVTITAE